MIIPNKHSGYLTGIRLYNGSGGGGSTTSQSIPEWAVPYLKNVGGQAESLYGSGDLGKVAGESALQKSAFTTGAQALGTATGQGMDRLVDQQDRLTDIATSGGYDTTALKDKAILEAGMKTAQLGQQYGASGTLGSARQAVQQGANNAATAALSAGSYLVRKYKRARLTRKTAQKTKFKGYGSRTKLRYKKRGGYGDSGGHDSMRKVYKHIVLRKAIKYTKPLGEWQYTNQCSGYGSSGCGSQASSNLLALLSPLQLTSSAGNTAPSLYETQYKFETCLFNQMIDSNIYQSNFLQAGVKPTNFKIVCKKIDFDVQIASGTQVAQHFDFMILINRKTGENMSPSKVWENALVDKRLGQAASAVTSDFAVAPTPGYSTTATYGKSPFENKEFNSFFRTVYRNSFVLNGGDVKKFIFSIAVNKVLDYGKITKELAGLTQDAHTTLGGVTMTCFLIARPAPVHIKSTDDTKGHGATTGEASYFYTSTQTYHMTALPMSSTAEYERVNPQLVYNSNVVGAKNFVSDIINVVDAVVPTTDMTEDI